MQEHGTEVVCRPLRVATAAAAAQRSRHHALGAFRVSLAVASFCKPSKSRARANELWDFTLHCDRASESFPEAPG